jgi:hypothetical protein
VAICRNEDGRNELDLPYSASDQAPTQKCEVEKREIRGLTANFLYPPSRPDEQKAVIPEKLGRLSFKVMPYKLQYPADEKEGESGDPKIGD